MIESSGTSEGSKGTPQGTPWISEENRGDEFYEHVYRVVVPDEGKFLVRADDERRAAGYVVEELNYCVVDEMVERCEVTPTLDVAAPGLKNIDVYPVWREGTSAAAGDGDYAYEAGWYGPVFRAGIVGFSDDSEYEAVENLISALLRLGISGYVRVADPSEPEPIALAQWRARSHPDCQAQGDDAGMGPHGDDWEEG